MILTDAGPLIAIINGGDAFHERCVAALERVSLPLVTTWPAFTEAIYLVGAVGGWRGQAGLWTLVERDDLQIADLSEAAMARMRALMDQYRDLPMDLAVASLVALAEERGLSSIFTLDSDFQVSRLPRKKPFTLIP
jgi:predicted nucleic acid-binding protein